MKTPGNTQSMLMTVGDVKDALSVSERTVWRLLDAGHLPKVKLGKRTLVKREAVEAFVEQCCRAAMP